ncbi:MAG: FISUMP domain-containing protein [Bacteroidota bacterium]
MKQIGPYLILEKTYSGELTSTYQATNEPLGTKVVITLLNEDGAANQAIKNRFLKLCQKWAALDNECLPKWIDLFDNEYGVGFATEHFDGKSLSQFIQKNGKIDQSQIKKISLKILSTLLFIHENNLYHGNLNAHSFLLLDGHEPRLTYLIQDIVLDSAGQSSKIFSTQPVSNTIAPEAITQSSPISSKSDIYSFGVILWEMVSGKKAFDFPFYEIPTRIVNENLPLTNSPWDEIIQKATAKSPNDRFDSCRSIMNAIQLMTGTTSMPKIEKHPVLVANPAPTPAPIAPTNPSIRKEKAERNNKIKKTVIGSVALLLLVAATLSYWPNISNWISSVFKSSSGNSNGKSGTEMVDMDGNRYGSVKIGELYWTTSNLRTTKYSNGDPISNMESDREWIYAKRGAYCFYDNQPENIENWGNLYNWHAVNDYRGLCPEGWRVPTANDFRMLDNHLEDNGLSSGAVKSIDGWSNPNVDATNFGGLNILPSGKRMFSSGGFKFRNDGAYFWTSDEHSTRKAIYVAYAFDRSTSNQNEYYKNDGFSCRCVKDVRPKSYSESAEQSGLSDTPGSYDATVVRATSNSTMSGMSGFSYEPYKAIDKDINTWWSPKNGYGDENWIQIDFNSKVSMSGIQIHGGSHYPDFRSYGDLYPLNLRVKKAEIVFDDGTKEIISLDDIDAIQTIIFKSPKTTRYFRLYPFDFYPSRKWNDLCISEIIPIYN